MATLRVIQYSEDYNFPEEYRRIVNGDDNYSYMSPVDSEVEGFTKYVFGRYFKKNSNISKPTETALEDRDYFIPVNLKAFIYIPEDNSTIFILGSSLDSLFDDFLSLLNLDPETTTVFDEEIDIANLERISFERRGTMKLVGHKYNKGGTVSFMVRKTDGSSFDNDDPDFESCDNFDKEFLEVKLILEGTTEPESYNIYSSGKITRKGVSNSATDTFSHFYSVHNLITNQLARA